MNPHPFFFHVCTPMDRGYEQRHAQNIVELGRMIAEYVMEGRDTVCIRKMGELEIEHPPTGVKMKHLDVWMWFVKDEQPQGEASDRGDDRAPRRLEPSTASVQGGVFYYPDDTFRLPRPRMQGIVYPE